MIYIYIIINNKMLSLYKTLVLYTIFYFSEARGIRINRGSSCHCRHRIQKERDDAINSLDNTINMFNNLKKFITISKCSDGEYFNYDTFIRDNKFVCDKCPINHFRFGNMSTCLPCSEGFVSNSGSSKCIKCRKNIDKKCITYSDIFCPINHIISNDPISTLGSCIKCDPKKKEYINYSNQEEKCLQCSSGSYINTNIIPFVCLKCPIGTFEKNNKCHNCPIGFYSDKEGSDKCIKCNNEKSLAYSIEGSNNCDDSIYYELSNTINSIVDINSITYPIVNIAQFSTIYLLNNKNIISNIGLISSGIFTTMYMFS